jgi:hypothetical protein
MSASTFRPTDTLTTREIAIPGARGLQPNQPIPAPLHKVVERQPVGHTNGPNPSGGYVSPILTKARVGELSKVPSDFARGQ